MRTFFSNRFYKLKSYSQRISESHLTSSVRWRVFDPGSSQTVYTFEAFGKLSINEGGKVSTGKWSVSGNKFEIRRKHDSYFFENFYFDFSILILQMPDQKDFHILLNESSFSDMPQSLDELLKILGEKHPEIRAIDDGPGPEYSEVVVSRWNPRALLIGSLMLIGFMLIPIVGWVTSDSKSSKPTVYTPVVEEVVSPPRIFEFLPPLLFGPDTIPRNGIWKIWAYSLSPDINVTSFPEIDGFILGQRSQEEASLIKDGDTLKIYSNCGSYHPTKEGLLTFDSLEIQISDQWFKFPGRSVYVSSKIDTIRQDEFFYFLDALEEKLIR